ncbi:hypothetical protein [Halanaerobium sp. ST460_2HS_T2]|uniref:hypothetical protein n=1 Tax=Halanaerobium sp. ST460_2HS_T2 TaxID=2183914 RepID=UPI000DF2F571|nr:hypothetical protein [Halanaerobium sp. ST460_2HS_T2]RCW57347.1 hypothetical protein DFR80_11334 [Halanaerobium sp. ST460_2HS_T2]
MNMKIIATAVLIIILTLSLPLLAAEDDYIDLNDYDLDLTVEQKTILKDELTTMVDIYGEIDLGMIKIILGELEDNNDEFEDDYDGDYDENYNGDNFGRGLAQRIKAYKANNEDWTGQGLSNMIHNYMQNNHPGKGKAKGKYKNPVNGNNSGKGKGNNPGKGN